MFADTVVKLHQEGVNENLCIAGGTMAYLHDVIQGLDGFPGTGMNENVTAKFVNFLIDEGIREGMDPDVGEALKSLSNATIVGGTFLVGVEVPTGDDGKTQGKNQTPEECVDNSDLRETTGRPNDYDDLSKVRNALAENDISRTQAKNEKGAPQYTLRPAPPENRPLSDKTDKTASEKLIASCYNAKASAYDQRMQAIQDNKAFQHLEIPVEQFARVCKSVRMLCEILPKTPGSTFNEGAIVNHLRNGNELTDETRPGYEQSMGQLVTKLKNPITWAGGMVPDPQAESGTKYAPGEAQFAMPSGHTEYADTLLSSEFKEKVSSMSEDQVKALVKCALFDIQDGRYIRAHLEG